MPKKEIYWKRKNSGICVYCGKKPISQISYCEDCYKSYRKSKKKNYIKFKDKYDLNNIIGYKKRLTKGLCPSCGKNKLYTKRLCFECNQKHLKRKRDKLKQNKLNSMDCFSFSMYLREQLL